jgi:hypothetical protein
LIYVLPFQNDQPVKSIFVLPTQNDQLVELVFILLVQIVIPHDTFKQHLPETFSQHEVGKMEIDETLAWIKVQNLRIIGWIVIKEEQLIKINLGSEKKSQ